MRRRARQHGRWRATCAGLVGLVGLAALAGCSSDDEARFEGTISDDCYASVFPLEPDHFAALQAETGALLRMEALNRERTRTDGFYLTIDEAFDGSGVACPSLDALAGGSFEVGPDRCVRGYFRFNYSCREAYINAQVIGQVTFERFGLEDGDIISGVVQGQVADVKEVEAFGATGVHTEPLGSVDGSFRFEVVLDAPRIIYTSPPRPPVDI